MRKTAPDGDDSAGELPDVTTDAHSQSANDSEDSLAERTGAGSDPVEGADTSPEPAAPQIASDDAHIEPSDSLAAEQSALTAADPPAEQPAQTLADPTAERSDKELDFDEAERFAASFRPSWEPDLPARPLVPPVQFVGTPGGTARVIRHTSRGDLRAPKLRKQRGGAYAILGGSLLGVAGLLYIAIASSSVHPSAKRTLAPSASEPTETRHQAIAAAREVEAPREPDPPSEPPPTLAEPIAAALPSEAADPAVDPPAVEPPPEAAEPAQPSPSVASPQPSAAAHATQPVATPPAQSKHVLLRLAAHPPNTRLRLDGAPIDNPFRAWLPRASKHRIEARAPGFAPEVHALRLEADVQLMISLKREPPRDVKPDPYRERRSAAVAQPGPSRKRGAGFVAENPY